MLSPNLKPPEAVIFRISQSESFILIWLGVAVLRPQAQGRIFRCDSSLFASKVTNAAF